MARRKDETPDEDAAATLGALLYADPGRSRPTEDEWVALVRSIAAGDEVALHALYRRTHRIVFTLIMRIVADTSTAEELTLDLFHDVWRRAPGYDPAAGTVVGWIMNQARSRAIDRHRFEHRRKRVDPERGDPLPLATADASTAVEQRDRATHVREALSVLSPDERSAIETTFFGELTHAQAAAQLGQPLGTLKTRIRSGLQKLRVALAEGGKVP